MAKKKAPDVIDSGEEMWKPVSGWEGLYEVSSYGRVKSLARMTSSGNRSVPERILKHNVMKGYHCVTLQYDGRVKVYRVHRLVIGAFGESQPSEEYEVNHIDGDKSNNSIENLEWVTPKENTDHAFDTGLRPRKDRPETIQKKRNALIRRYQDPKEREKTGESSKKMWKMRKEKGWESWKTWN
jgi:hypothetical protein